VAAAPGQEIVVDVGENAQAVARDLKANERLIGEKGKVLLTFFTDK
jgi:hypothetical protein